jgi:hypothetical protein
MRHLILVFFVFFTINSIAQTRKVSISQVGYWHRPFVRTNFISQQGGNFGFTHTLQFHQKSFLKGLYSYKIYPNPSDGFLRIHGSFLPSIIFLYNAQGIMVDKLEPKIIDSQNSEIEIKELPPGLYILQATGFVSNRLQLN